MDSHPENAEWTAARLAAVAPTWEPDPVRARMRVRARPATPSRRLMYTAAAATAMLTVAFVSPSGRALAQDLWYRWFVTRVAVVRVDLSKIPFDTSIRITGAAPEVASVDEAAAAAGFTPYLPTSEGLPGAPVLSVLPPVEVTQTIRGRALTAALEAAGASDVVVPAEWDGVRLRAVVGPTVVARYLVDAGPGAREPGDVELIQLPPIRLEMPASFPLARFAEAAFRSAGLTPRDARQLAEEYAAQPAWLLDRRADHPVVIETVPLPGGDGLLIEDADETGDERVLIVVSRKTRLYAITGPDRELPLRIAGALP